MSTEAPARLFPARATTPPTPTRASLAEEYASLYAAQFDLSTPASRAAAIKAWLDRDSDERAFIATHLQAMQLQATLAHNALMERVAVLLVEHGVKLGEAVDVAHASVEAISSLALEFRTAPAEVTP